MSASDPLACALRLLSRRDRSEMELEQSLRRKGFAPERIEDTLARCRELGYVDDERFALNRARARLRDGRAVGQKLLLDLRRSGIEEDPARHAMEEALSEKNTSEVLRDLAQRRFSGFDYAQANERERRRVIEFFLRRGFALSQVLSFFQEER